MKLTDMARVAGLTAGAEVMAKMTRPQDITFNPELDIFEIDDGLVETLAQDMREHGFDKSQPLTVWKDQGCVADGRTRLRAALAAGLAEIPVVEKEFSGLEEAIRYAFRRQAERRNLTQGEILEAAVRLGIKDRRDGTGRSREELAKDLGVSESTITHARTVAKRGSREDLEAIKKGDKTINEVYRDLREKKAKEPDIVSRFTDFEGGGDIDTPPMPVMPEEPEGLIDPLEGGETETTGEDTENAVSETGGLGADGGEEGEEAADEPADWGGGPELPETFAEEGEAEEQGRKDRVPDYGDIGDSLQIKFLRSVVILLCENKQIEGAGLLIRHFVRRKNIPLFTAVLPEKTREILAAYGGPQDGGGE